MLLLRHLKSYLPAHSILRGFVALHLCDFADAIRTGCAEAKARGRLSAPALRMMQSVRDVLRQRNSGCALQYVSYDAIRVGCAEAKSDLLRVRSLSRDAIRAGCAEAKGIKNSFFLTIARCSPCGMC